MIGRPRNSQLPSNSTRFSFPSNTQRNDAHRRNLDNSPAMIKCGAISLPIFFKELRLIGVWFTVHLKALPILLNTAIPFLILILGKIKVSVLNGREAPDRPMDFRLSA